MSDVTEGKDHWFEVIGKSLAYLCLKEAEKADSTKMASVPNKVKFLMGLGLSQGQAAEAVGSTRESVSELLRRQKTKGGGKSGKKSKK